MSRPYKLTRNQLKSLCLHQAVADRLVADSDEVLGKARANLDRLLKQHRATTTEIWLKRWQNKIDEGVGAVLEALTSEDSEAVELRQNSPFAGVLPEPHRQQILASFSAATRAAAKTASASRQQDGEAVLDTADVRAWLAEAAVDERGTHEDSVETLRARLVY